jgi:carbonic anhydrase
MSQIHQEVLQSNADYASAFGDKARLALPPARRFAILTCMDARLDPAKFAGLREGDAHVIRNAGGRASDDAIRSLVISYKLLGTREFFVIHHTDCGMETFTDTVIRGLLANSLETATIDASGWHDIGAGPGSRAGEYIDWLTIDNQAQAVTDDVERIRRHPLVPDDIPIYGYVYDVRSGKLIEVPQATHVGKALRWQSRSVPPRCRGVDRDETRFTRSKRTAWWPCSWVDRDKTRFTPFEAHRTVAGCAGWTETRLGSPRSNRIAP